MQAGITCFSSGHREFERLGETFISLSEATTKIHQVSSAVKANFGEDYVVVTADSLEVLDSTGTQGM